MEMQTFCCLIITVIILGVVGVMAYIKRDEKKTTNTIKVSSAHRKYDENKKGFYEVLSIFFNNTYCSYQAAYSILRSNISLMEESDGELKSLSENGDDGTISACSKTAEEFAAFGKRVNSLPYD